MLLLVMDNFQASDAHDGCKIFLFCCIILVYLSFSPISFIGQWSCCPSAPGK